MGNHPRFQSGIEYTNASYDSTSKVYLYPHSSTTTMVRYSVQRSITLLLHCSVTHPGKEAAVKLLGFTVSGVPSIILSRHQVSKVSTPGCDPQYSRPNSRPYSPLTIQHYVQPARLGWVCAYPERPVPLHCFHTSPRRLTIP